jgi:uncharacterized protein YdaU (DUF1376 family)
MQGHVYQGWFPDASLATKRWLKLAEFPALPLWTDAYLGDTTHLTTIEHGAYLLLLMAMWRNKGSLPDDDRMLARYARMTSTQWSRLAPTIMPFFRRENGVITQGRLTDELNRVRQVSHRQSDNVKARWLKTNKSLDTTVIPNAYQSDTPITTPISIKEEAKASLSSDADDLAKALSDYNEAAGQAGWPKVQSFTAERRAALRARLKECGGLDGWAIALSKARASPHCSGQNDRGWMASFDFLVAKKTFTKLMEGNYDPKPNHNNSRGNPGFRTGHDDLLAGFQRAASRDDPWAKSVG